MKSEHFQTLLRISFFFGFLVILYRIIDFNTLQDALKQVNILIVCVAVGIYFANIGIRACRLQMILNHKKRHIAFKDAYVITLIGVTLNMIIPATLGDIAKSYYGYKIYGIKEEMLSTSVVDKLFALCALFILGTISGWLLGYHVLSLVSFSAFLFTFLPLAFPEKIPWHLINILLARFKKSLDSEKLLTAFKLPSLLKISVMGISLIGWLCTCFYFYILCLAFPVQVNFGYIIAMMPIITIIRLFPFTVNAIGPAEVAVAYFFERIGIHSTLAVLISLSSNMISSVIPGFIGLCMIFTMSYKGKQQKS